MNATVATTAVTVVTIAVFRKVQAHRSMRVAKDFAETQRTVDAMMARLDAKRNQATTV